RSHMSQLGAEHVARLRTMMERERRQGVDSAEQALKAALDDVSAGPRRRRRRRVEKADETTSPTADAAEAMAAEAAEEAAERGAQLVTEGGDEPTDTTVIVESEAVEPPPAEAAPEKAAAAEAAEAPAQPAAEEAPK